MHAEILFYLREGNSIPDSMLDFIKHLSADEQQIVAQSPMYVSLLIAGSDGNFDTDEKKRIVELIHIKTFTERFELQTLYKQLSINSEENIRNMISSLPENTDERNQLLSDLIARLNDIFPKLDSNIATQLYSSLRQFAVYISTADGGWWGISSVSDSEKNYVKLPMLNSPAQ
ncbi:MAG: hypothetical protein EBV15_08545 [Bacteroidetes bacterium]|nr:hypothetical protein [Bacteroidota bacterium]